MAWFLLILVLTQAIGLVIQNAFLVLTILTTLAVLGVVAWYGIRLQLRRWQHETAGGGSQPWIRTSERPRDLPSHDDRY